MADYKIHGTSVIRMLDGAIIPKSDGNRDWDTYQEWLKAGNAPDPEFSAEELAAHVKAAAISQVQALEASQARTIREALLTGDMTRLKNIEHRVAQLMGRAPVVQ